MNWLINFLITGFAIWLAAIILPGVTVRNFITALWVGFLLALINGTLGWILRFITTPFNWITFGLVYFIINVLMIMLVDKIVPGFKIRNFLWAVIFALFISLISALTGRIVF